MRISNFTTLYEHSIVHCKRLWLALIILLALCAVSCRTTRNSSKLTSQQTSQSDSLNGRRLLLWSEGIPQSKVTLTIPNDSLARLPKGACYSGKEGQASVRVSRDDANNVVVESYCDSIQQRCLYLEDEIVRIRDALQSQEAASATASGPTVWQWFWIRTGQVLTGAALAILAIILLKRHFKYI